jgi:dTDP-4-dehydrorhamnose 3,5-epimerase-like enzyme
MKPFWIVQKEIIDAAGNLQILELPFTFKRIYYIHGVPDSAKRGFHSHKSLHQIFLMPKGNMTLELSTPSSTEIFELDSREPRALHVPPGYWRVLSEFSHDAIVLVLASEHYDEGDYIRNFDEYVKWFNEVISNES